MPASYPELSAGEFYVAKPPPVLALKAGAMNFGNSRQNNHNHQQIKGLWHEYVPLMNMD